MNMIQEQSVYKWHPEHLGIYTNTLPFTRTHIHSDAKILLNIFLSRQHNEGRVGCTQYILQFFSVFFCFFFFCFFFCFFPFFFIWFYLIFDFFFNPSPTVHSILQLSGVFFGGFNYPTLFNAKSVIVSRERWVKK